ncbi:MULTISPECIES: branched-chain amino acid ABC transporter permease [Marivita]|uniref:Branched-chain amino acid ABC transporter permease n=1 Tax=Marivita cryptomonadis TaxID=505252 RepID=A0A9Q2P179_9RHOB|nr:MULTISPECIES: branched-chain amino acid ABC transporter permease [Marivita]MCR9167419.1 branched-chain amino acid ABC transporter permease [Paracoccaceae bacterium]MBM2322538.1 branched-chain amino acid ABC transporter permease [Marivita cryptomonadis]MBM2332120.1 branched-chain amino acid ABC transporter permease [Marivita cryptomonadis]MBM2341704.1 branched-chain amino acid ABC transporter permease [Marivita cryptomonadis]MBM2346368.1 branched-chain amino acid ABC transporter permease [Ma
MFRHNALRYAVLALLAAGALFQALTAEYFGLEILTEILILAMLVLALDIVAGFGGMVSLCHGALMGVGAYTYAILSTKAGIAPPVAMAGSIALTGVAAWVIGAICSRSHGIYFIMATLAFGQMAYSYVFEAPIFGGDDGLGGISRLDLSFIGVDLNDSRSFALFCLALLAAIYVASVLILRSGLGRSLSGVMHNEQRMRALGLTVWRVKADVFGLSGMIAGLAGALAAQHILYISPGLLSWTVSGEALVVVILGGLGTLVGPLVGAAAFVVLKHELSAVTTYWHLVVGVILIAVVMSRANGVFGWFESRWGDRIERRMADATRKQQSEEVLTDA